MAPIGRSTRREPYRLTAARRPGPEGHLSLAVLHVASGREWRGGQRQVWLLARELARLGGVRQAVVTAAGGVLASRLRDDGIAVHAVAWRAGLDPRALIEIRRRVALGPALLHAHDPHALVLADLARSGTGLPVVATRRVTFPLRRPGSWARAERVLALSTSVRDALLRGGVRAERVEVVSSGLDLESLAALPPAGLRPRIGLPDGTVLAMAVAAFTREKDHATLLRAAALVRREVPELHWVLLGDGPLREAIKRQITALDLRDRVHLLGAEPDAEALIAEASLLVLSSTSEGFGTAALAALALGVPVVGTRAGGLGELLASDVGLLVPVADPAAMAAAVRRVVREPVLRRELAGRGRVKARQFSARAMAEQVLAVYRSCAQAY